MNKCHQEPNKICVPRLALTVSLACAAIYLTALVAPGQCKDNNLRVSKSATKSSEVPLFGASNSPLGEFSRAESGVKLLVGIFARLGNEPQLALKSENRLLASSKNKSGFDRESQSQLLAAAQSNASNYQSRNSQFANSINNQYTDPALAIRPRAVSRKSASDKFIPIQGVTIAMAPQKKTFYKGESHDEKRDERGSAAGQGGASPQAEGYRSDADSSSSLRSRDDSPVKIFAGPSSTSNALPAGSNEKTYIREFGKAANAPAAPAIASYGRNAERSIIISDEPVTISDRRQSQLRAEETANGIIRPTEQPGLFKYVREHKKETPKDNPRDNLKESVRDSSKDLAFGSQSAAAALDQLNESKLINKQKLKSAKLQNSAQLSIVSENEMTLEAQQDGSPLQVAFLPPSTVHGINGLPLGASEADTAKFFKNRGNLSRSFISGWKVWTLLDGQQTPILQVYLRNGRTEAFRIFNQSYVPAGLGVAINDELPSMKGKFGEPSFILEEPGIKPQMAAQSATIVAKNYVYPVSQVSFQLVRNGPSSPHIHSLLLFRYL
jgi:hypothetical protein